MTSRAQKSIRKGPKLVGSNQASRAIAGARKATKMNKTMAKPKSGAKPKRIGRKPKMLSSHGSKAGY